MSKKYFLLAFFCSSALFLTSTRDSVLAQHREKRFHREVCSGDKAEIRCHAHVVTDETGKPEATIISPTGLSPQQLSTAYGFTGVPLGNQTIAIVDAYDNPNISSDLNSYSTYFGLPQLSSCPVTQGTIQKPCFQKVSQKGTNKLPQPNSGWGLEEALDVEIAHAMCRNCNILLVEANSATYNNLMTAVDTAVAMGAKVVSNSYGSNEFLGETQFDFHFNKPGVVFTFSSGDSGFGTSYPAASKNVIAVGGTTLNMTGNSYVGETVWGGSGSGCSLYEDKPAWQTDASCTKRTISDVSAVADPETGASIYNTFGYQGQKGWFTVGGTSLSSPIIAGAYALGGVPNGQIGSLLYTTTGSFHDITIGTNGTCSVPYLCQGATGYDGPTGLGTPNGISAF